MTALQSPPATIPGARVEAGAAVTQLGCFPCNWPSSAWEDGSGLIPESPSVPSSHTQPVEP